MPGKKILMIVGDFVENLEAWVPFQALRMAGHSVDTVCPGKRSGEKVITAVHDDTGEQTYSEKPGHFFPVTTDFDTVDPGTYDALLLPGGRAPEYLRMNEKVLQIIRHFSNEMKPIAAICHAAQLMAAADVLRGCKCSAYPAVAPEVREAGGEYMDIGAEEAYTDGNLVTAQSWTAHPQWLAQFLKVLGTRIEHEQTVSA